jgi:formamidopyrimidine-DNA glycosylase
MPELPEVETIRRQIEPYLPITITKVSKGKHYKKILRSKDFKLEHLTIKQINRHGKYILIDLGQTLMIVHLGMSGRLQLHQSPLLEKHIHYTLHSEKINISYVDPRRFGFLKFISKKDFHYSLLNTGPDIKSDEFTLDYLECALKKYPNRKLKVTLLDQKLFAGIGNYLASEICARSFITPTRLCSKIKKNEFEMIFKAIHTTLDESIKTAGTTFSGGYKDAYGDEGKGVENLVVFHQEFCQMCKKTKTKSLILAGRNTFYCPHCQR